MRGAEQGGVASALPSTACTPSQLSWILGTSVCPDLLLDQSHHFDTSPPLARQPARPDQQFIIAILPGGTHFGMWIDTHYSLRVDYRRSYISINVQGMQFRLIATVLICLVLSFQAALAGPLASSPCHLTSQSQAACCRNDACSRRSQAGIAECSSSCIVQTVGLPKNFTLSVATEDGLQWALGGDTFKSLVIRPPVPPPRGLDTTLYV